MRQALVTLALAPVLLLQGRRVRRRWRPLPEPQGARQGIAGCGPILRLLLTGDSAAAGVGVPTQDEALSGRLVAALAPAVEVRWKLLAQTGTTTADLLLRLNRTAAEDFDVVVTSLGVNDVTGRRPLAEWRRAQQQLIGLLEDRFGARHILLNGLPPMHRFPALPQPLRWYLGRRARDFDRTLAELAAGRANCEYLHFAEAMLESEAMAEDGFHPGAAIYESWAARLAGRILARRAETIPEDGGGREG